MTSLLDIGPLTETVMVNGKQVTVYGVTPEGFFFMLEKFPMLQKLFGGGAREITMPMLREAAPSSIAYAIAVATTDRSHFKTTTEWLETVDATAIIAMNLSAHYQIALFQAALRLTFPDGIGPFMKGMGELADSINRISGQQVQDMTSSKPSRSGFETDSRGLRLGKAARPASSTH
jgi:hypothetical protein